MKKQLVFFILFIVLACVPKKEKLPFLGEKDISNKIVNGKSVADTIYHRIPAFSFINQDSLVVTNANFANKIYVTDFFFTTCPTICPKMKTQMLDLYKYFNANKEVAFLSHTIDPRHDTPVVLKEYAKKLAVNTDKWTFVTGQKEKIYEIALKGYMATAQEDSTAEGGFVHSGAFILVDKMQRVRGIYDGTKKEEAELMKKDIETLLEETKQ